RDAEGDHRLDRLGAGLVQERHLNPGGIGIAAVRHGQDTSSASHSLDRPAYWTDPPHFLGVRRPALLRIPARRPGRNRVHAPTGADRSEWRPGATATPPVAT